MHHSSRAQLLIWIACWILAVRTAHALNPSPTVPPGANLPYAPACYTTTTTAVSSDTVLSSIHIKSAADIASVRSQLASEIWGSGRLPTVLASSTVQTTSGNTSSNASGLYTYLSGSNSYMSSEWRLTVNLLTSPFVTSIVYEWIPKIANGRLFIVHDGHSDDAYNSDGTVQTRAIAGSDNGVRLNQVTVNSLLQAGYTVLWLQMPLYGDNLTSSSGVSFPNCHSSSVYTINLSSQCDRHGGMFADSTHYPNPFRYFIEPVVVAINTVIAQRMFSDISMMGASGGGWTTVLAAAVDPRIANSASVAGSLPLFFPGASDSCGISRDAEQNDEPGSLYESISYLDLYILAASGTAPNGVNRRHMQIDNQFDTCCFYGINFLGYVPVLSSYISQNNFGNYSYYLDTTFVGHGYDLGSVKGAAAINPGCVVANTSDCAINNTLGIVLQKPQVTVILDSLLEQ